MLVLARNVGEVIEVDKELYIEINETLGNSKVKVYVYDKIKDEEYLKFISDEDYIDIFWNGKNVKVKLAKRYYVYGKKQVKIGIEADKDIKIGRDSRIRYTHYVDSKGFSEGDYYEDEYEEEDSEYVVKYNDPLVEKYKDDLSWFFN